LVIAYDLDLTSTA